MTTPPPRPRPAARERPRRLGALAALARFALLAVLLAPVARAETLRPLLTEDTETLAPGAFELQISGEGFSDFQSPSSELHGRLVRAPIVGLNVGLGSRAELQLRSPLRQFFSPAGAASRSATGDVTMATKVHLLGARSLGPSLGARALVKLPNVSETTGIGTDETDVTLEVLGGLHLGAATIATSVGYAILGDPHTPASQNDKVVFGAGFFLPLGLLDVGADLHGIRFGEGKTMDEWTAIGALARSIGRTRFDLGVGLLSRERENAFLLSGGVTVTFRLPRRP